MQENDEAIREKLKKCYVAAYQTLQFSKTNKTNYETADIERRCLFTKYIICKHEINEDVAGTILQNELENYTRLVDNQNGLNNYWQQINSLNIMTNNNPLQWRPCLNDPNLALQFLEKLPCTTENTSTCKNKNYVDKDVEKVMKLWKNEDTSPRMRKRPQLETNVIQINNKENQNKDKFFELSKKDVEIEKNNEKQHSRFEKQYSNPEKINRNKINVPVKNEILQIDKKDEKSQEIKYSAFKTAKVVLKNQQIKNNKNSVSNIRPPSVKKSLGGKFVNSPYVNPLKDEQPKQEESCEPIDERLKNIEPKMIELIKNEIMDSGNPVSWDDIAGLDHAKRIIKEIVVFPMLRPDIFTGLRRPPKGILLFGPPGTGKTLIGKCIASQSKSTFFSISASSLTSKWIGEGEKMVRALFAVARVEQPSVVFIDEIDSLLCQRSETEHESSRRMKTEFLVQLDGAATGDEDRILVIGATNRPYELDEAARRRLVKRLYIPLPELEARAQIIRNLLKSECHSLTTDDVYKIAKLAEGYSGADMTNLCKEASMGPIRSIPFEELEDIRQENVRKMTFLDFQEALNAIRPSVSQKDLSVYIDWDLTYGTASVQTRL